jgi:hypothetical protein
MRILKISLISMLFMLVCVNVFAGTIESDLRCFIDKSTQKTKLEMRVYSDEERNWSGGYIKYGKNKSPIPIVFQSSKVIDENEGRPSTFETVWLEIAATEATGKYTTVTQGSHVYSLEYLGRKSKKIYKFDETVQRDIKGDSCKW